MSVDPLLKKTSIAFIYSLERNTQFKQKRIITNEHVYYVGNGFH